MLFQAVFSVFLVFEFSESFQELNTSWNPCPPLRSTFLDIYVDEEGRRRPNCVCKSDLFGDQCQFKVYVSHSLDSVDEKQSVIQKNSHQPEHNIYPLEYLDLHQYPNRSTVIKWRHANITGVQLYVLQFRELGGVNGSWRTLMYIKSGYFQSQNLMLFKFDDLYYANYEINLGIISNDDVIVSVSVLHDTWRVDEFQGRQDVRLHDVMFSASVTWSAWNAWGTCETQHACGKGKQRRSRILGTSHCVSDQDEETRPCKLKSCPVDGSWSPWSSWSQCSVTCDNGTRSIIRSCTSPAPKHGGEMCFGLRRIKQTCANEPCRQIIGKWSTLEKLKSLEFTSIVVGFAAGFVISLLITACPQLLKRCKRNLREKYKLLKDKDENLTDFAKVPKHQMPPLFPRQPPPNPPLPPPFPPPPPAMNWRPIPLQHVLPSSPQPTQPKPGTSQGAWKPMHMVQPQHFQEANPFLDELLKAFRTFNVDPKLENPSDKRPP